MKKLASICLALVLCLMLIPSARAEGVNAEEEAPDLSRIQWAMAMTAHMAGNALDRTEEAQTSLERHYLNQFAQLPYMAPDKAIVLKFTKDQAASAQAILGVDGWDAVGPAAAGFINQRFSPQFANAADRAKAEGSTAAEPFESFTLILLTYGIDLSLTSLSASGAVNSRSAFIISTRQINEQLGEADLNQYIVALGLENPLVRIYEKTDLDTMFRGAPWDTGSASFQHMASCLLASEKRKQLLLPSWMSSDSPYITLNMRCGMMIVLLRSMQTADQATLIELASVWLPRLSQNTVDPVGYLMKEGYAATELAIVPPAVEYGEELHEQDLREDGTFLVVFELSVPEQETISWYDVILEAALPPANIPQAVEDADYIIRCAVTYEGGVSKGETHLHYPLTHISVHDARTGEMLRDLGVVKRTLNGVVTLPQGDTWWHPLYGQVRSRIQLLFTDH